MLRRPTPRFVGLVLLVVVPYLTGCTTWQPIRLDSDRFKDKPPAVVRVTLLDGRKITLQRPCIVRDSLLTEGTPPRTSYDEWRTIQPDPPYIPLRTIGRAEAQNSNAVGTFLLVGVGFAAILAIAFAASMNDFMDGGWGGGGGSGGGDYAGSCPLIDSWTGDRWVLDSGTFGGAIFPALTRTDLDNLPNAVAIDGDVRLRLRDQAPETEYADALTLLAVDHPEGVDVAPAADGTLVTLGTPAPPLAARDFRGADALDRVRAVDDLFWESSPARRDPAVAADIRDGLELEFARPADAAHARLVVDGNSSAWAARLMQVFVWMHGRDWATWTRQMEADSTAARALGRQFAAEGFLAVSVWTDQGWERQGTIPEAGPEVMKRQVLPLDLTRAAGDPIRVRLESAPLFWTLDRVALDASAPAPLRVQALEPARAVDARGVDIRPQLTSIDHAYYVMEFGDSADVVFHAPPIQPGLARSYLARTNGWYRINGGGTAEPRTALLQRLRGEPLAISRIAVEEMNRVMAPAR